MPRFFACHRSVFHPVTGTLLFSVAAGVAGIQSPIHAEDVLPLEGPSFSARLDSVDNKQFVFLLLEEKQQHRALAVDEFVRWSHPVAPRASTHVLLARGDVIVVAEDWTGDESVRMDGNLLTVVTEGCDEIELPRQVVKAVRFSQHGDSINRGSRPTLPSSGNTRTDTLYLNNGDRLRGTVTTLNGKEVVLQTQSATRRFAVSQVESVVFNPSLLKPSGKRAARLAVGLQDGSLFYATDLTVGGERFEIVLGEGNRLEGRDPKKIVFLQALHGPRLQYLSQTEPVDYRHVPYLNIPWPYGRDQNLLGGRLQSNGKFYLAGLSAHSASRMVYPLDGRFRRFEAGVALDDTAGRRGSVVFRVYLVREGQLEEAFVSKILRGGDPPQPVTVDLEGARHLALVVDYADHGDELDHANWLDARLVK